MQNGTVEETKVTQQVPGGKVETHTVTNSSAFSDFFVSKTNQVITSIVMIINMLIGLRFLFLLFGANQVGIVSFIMLITEIFVAPFKGIFASPAVGEAYFDLASILAIVIWTIVAIILSIIIKMFSSETE